MEVSIKKIHCGKCIRLTPNTKSHSLVNASLTMHFMERHGNRRSPAFGKSPLLTPQPQSKSVGCLREISNPTLTLHGPQTTLQVSVTRIRPLSSERQPRPHPRFRTHTRAAATCTLQVVTKQMLLFLVYLLYVLPFM